MLQNRLSPLGDLIKTAARGAWMGNRGLLHDGQKQIVRPFKLKAWITCTLEFKDRRRSLMAPGKYTELFSLDEATAFAAGHRPCAECRRNDYNKFKKTWVQGNPGFNFTASTPIAEIDNVIHQERWNPNVGKTLFEDLQKNLPNGTFILLEEQPFLLWDNYLYHWTPFGYDRRVSADNDDPVLVITPHSIVNAFRMGYTPQVDLQHPYVMYSK